MLKLPEVCPHSDSAALSDMMEGRSRPSALGPISSANPPWMISRGILPAPCQKLTPVSQSCGAPIDPVTHKTQVFSSATCATTSRVAPTWGCSMSKHFTSQEACCAVVLAGRALFFDHGLASTTCVPRCARSKSKPAREWSSSDSFKSNVRSSLSV